ncbi:hypothetical protein CC1G_06320 [Coprinopsis cinerea okayama7|uniref:Uncharacterized protein n=1 Tax=Coprinopsis cinerea (strain Okayama-7 / 130 / ATCC MYA-4618 / FGSC 9003) TaxID=240176 RepID=A8NTI1_COPC7|nr:hypothetical protein CC1G_06320 [Coprinopsis cinerea okayama7\|eukprot:XP_001836235.2 hypothetical protein CC1G_06320 [Coprinopsis cinerea okayama7\
MDYRSNNTLPSLGVDSPHIPGGFCGNSHGNSDMGWQGRPGQLVLSARVFQNSAISSPQQLSQDVFPEVQDEMWPVWDLSLSIVVVDEENLLTAETHKRTSDSTTVAKPLSRISEIPHISPGSLPKYLPDIPQTDEDTAQITVHDFLTRNAGVDVSDAQSHKKPKLRSYLARKRRTILSSPSSYAAAANNAGPSHFEAAFEIWDFPDARDASSEENTGIKLNLETSSSPSTKERRPRLRARPARRLVISDEDDSEQEGSSSSESATASEYHPGSSSPPNGANAKKEKESKKASRKKLLTKSLGTRLFEASVSTYGRPQDNLVLRSPRNKRGTEDNVAPTRRPLDFVPLSHDRSDQDGSSRTLDRRATLVDPRKAAPFSRASFCSTSQLALAAARTQPRCGSEEREKEFGRITNWKSRVVVAAASLDHPNSGDFSQAKEERIEIGQKRGVGGASGSGQGKLGKASKMHTSALVYPPLEFVPLTVDNNATRHDKKRRKQE